MRTLVGRRLGVLVLLAVLTGACTSVETEDEGPRPAETPALPLIELPPGLGVPGSGGTEPPRTLSFGDVEVVEMSIGEDASAPVAVAVHAIRRGDDDAVGRARRVGSTPTRSYYVDLSLTFVGLGVVEVSPFLTLAWGSREMNIQAVPMPLVRPFPPCPGTDAGVVLRAGERVDTCVVFPGPRPGRVRGVAMIDAPGAPTWEGPVS